MDAEHSRAFRVLDLEPAPHLFLPKAWTRSRLQTALASGSDGVLRLKQGKSSVAPVKPPKQQSLFHRHSAIANFLDLSDRVFLIIVARHEFFQRQKSHSLTDLLGHFVRSYPIAHHKSAGAGDANCDDRCNDESLTGHSWKGPSVRRGKDDVSASVSFMLASVPSTENQCGCGRRNDRIASTCQNANRQKQGSIDRRFHRRDALRVSRAKTQTGNLGA
jgi:hypothetical protein